MNFKTYFRKNWPPVNTKGKLATYHGKISNKFSQYLEYLLQKYCRSKNLYILNEVRCSEDDNKKMDYLICNETELKKYLWSNKKAIKIPADVCVEAQWDKNKFIKDFIKNDFPKLAKFKKTKLRVAIANVPELEFKAYLKRLRRKAGTKKNYLIYLFCKKRGLLHHIAVKDFKYPDKLKNGIKLSGKALF